MQINQKIKQEIVNLLQKQKVNIDINDITIPPSQEMGDLALPCFKLAEKIKKSPEQIAKDLASQIKPSGLIINLKNIGPYLNFILDYRRVAKLVLKEISRLKKNYGQNKIGQKKRVMIEYSQPNTHKEFHVGHLRNVCIGAALVNLYKISGYRVLAANYIGDSGAHVAKTLWYYNNFLNQTDFPAEPKERGEFLGQIYTRAVAELSERSDFKYEVQDVLKKLENGDPKLTTLWKRTRQWSLDQFKAIYKELDASFDVYFYESEEEKAGKKMLPQLLKYDFIKKSQGAIIADLEKYNLGILVLIRQDDTCLYGIKDIPLAIKKFKRYNIAKSIYVVDNRQSQYLQQIFKILELIGYKKEMVHVAYEFVQLKSGIMSSRTGNVVTYQEVKEAALAKVINETKKRHTDWSEKKINQTSLAIVIAALKFGMLKSSNNKIITFDLDEALDVNGFTGPYLQYTLARLNSIFFKSAKTCTGKTIKLDYENLSTNIEKKLLADLIEYENAIEHSLVNNDPSILVQHLYDLAQDFNTFYHELPVIKAEPAVRAARFELLKGIKQVLNNGLDLLSVPVLKEM